MHPRLRSTSAFLVTFAVPLGVYLASLRPDVSFWDTADLQTVPYILGIPYPTGFPGYVLAGWVWSHVLAVGSVAWRLNVLAAVASAATAAALAEFLIVLGAASAIAVMSALVYAFGATTWAHATYVDVHPIGFCAVAWAAVFALRWSRDGEARDGLAALAATAVALTLDNATALALPGVACIFFTRRPRFRPALMACAAAAAFVLATYAYLPLRSAAVTAARVDPTLSLGIAPGRPFWDDGHPASWAGFVRVVTGSDFAPHSALASLLSGPALHGVTDVFAPLAAHDLGGFVPWFAFLGALLLWWRMPVVLGGGLLTGLVPLLFAGAYLVESESTRYYMPALFVIVVAAGYGATALDTGLSSITRYAALSMLGFAWIALIVADVQSGASLFAQPSRHDGSDFIARIVSLTPAHAIVVAPWNYATPLAYAAYVERALGDRIVVTAGAYEFRQRYRAWLARRPIDVISDDPLRFRGFGARELDDGSPHVYALR